MRTYRVKKVQPLTLGASPYIDGDYLMSPYVWVQDGVHWMALRVVRVGANGLIGTSSICFAKGDGVDFQLEDMPALEPGPSAEDRDGCEDPTLFFHDGKCKVYYTGWNASIRQSRLLFASGPGIASLHKRGDVLHGIRHWNIKEASILETPIGWKLFYEYSERVHSLIGKARSDNPDGGWREEADPFGLREDSWDSWHLSTGPISFQDTDHPVMFYNGADKDARWRIGWVEFDRTCSQVTARCDDALVRPEHLPDGFPDIAFAASSLDLDEHTVELYFSIGDRNLCKAMIEVS